MAENGHWRMRRKTSTLTTDDFAFVPASAAAPGDGELLVRTRFIALDPYLARAMRAGAGEDADWPDGVIEGRVVAEVLETRSPRFASGQLVSGIGRWQQEQVVDAASFEPIAANIDPPSLSLGVFGRSGITAWVGLHLAKPLSGETLLVSAASGPVGSVVGQLAKKRGLRVVGTAGGLHKCAYVIEDLGFDACLDHRSPDFESEIAVAANGGFDILFENVGGPSLDAALPAMKHGGRIMLCGLAAHYNDDDPLVLRNFKNLLYRSLSLRGFVTAEHPDLFAPALAELQGGIDSGDIGHRETIIDGIDCAPAAYLEMLAGQGVGKRLIRP